MSETSADAQPFGPEEFAAAINVSRETLARLEAFVGLLGNRQSQVNLVAERSLSDVWRRHVLDSAQLAMLAPQNTAWLDLGSGNGFPALVLAILLRDIPGFRIDLIESVGKKARFLEEAIHLAQVPARVHHGRIEELLPFGAAVVTARACAPLEELLGYVARHLAPDGVALLQKGAGVQEELTRARRSWRFEVETLPSRTHPQGAILRCRKIEKRRP